MLLAGCRGKKAMWRRRRRGTSEVRHDSNRTHLVDQLVASGLLLGSRAPLDF